MDYIEKDFYPFPTQVKFGQRNDEGEIEENYGIAFQYHVVCLFCGYPFELSDEDIFILEELEWINVEDQLRP